MALAESIGAELEASLYRGGAALYRGPRLG